MKVIMMYDGEDNKMFKIERATTIGRNK